MERSARHRSSGPRRRDRGLLFAAAFVRALATGMVAVLIGIHLAQLRFDPAQIGVVVAAGLGGAAVATFFVILGGDRIGRRRFLLGLAVLGAGGGAVVSVASDPVVVAAAAFLGMLNGMGRDRGAPVVVEQAILPGMVPDGQRTRAFAWYNVAQDAGHALGGLLAGLPAALRHFHQVGEVGSMRLALSGYALLILSTAWLYASLSPAVEAAPRLRAPRVSPESRRTLARISALFALDSVGGGFLTSALLAFFFYERFGVSAEMIGALFFGARVANALSHLVAARLARRFGLVNTMVFTHIPASLLLVTVAYAPNFGVAAILFLLREGLVEMDVPTRQSYVMAVVRPEERTVAAGVTHLVRMSGWAVAPLFAGLLMQGHSLAMPLFVGAGMKIAYDVLLYLAFRNQRPPEEARNG